MTTCTNRMVGGMVAMVMAWAAPAMSADMS